MYKANNSTCLKYLMIVLSIMVLLVPSHAAEMYRWVDSEGVVHYSDEQPEGVITSQSVTVQEPDSKNDVSTREPTVPKKSKTASTVPAREPDTLHKIKNFPLIKQDHNWCALTSIAMVAQYYGYNIDPMQVSIESGIPLERGMTSEAILKYFEQLKALKLDIDYRYHGTLELIKQYIDNNIPVLWLHHSLVSRVWGRHVAVVIGYDDTARKMIVADPAYGTEIAVPYTEFLQRWHGARELIAVTSRI
jgi:hypothetical protein